MEKKAYLVTPIPSNLAVDDERNVEWGLEALFTGPELMVR